MAAIVNLPHTVGVEGETLSYSGLFHEFLLRQYPLPKNLYRAITNYPVT
jgi:hypothetical protein